MNADLVALILEARSWLERQSPAEKGSPKWYALGNFSRFVSQIDGEKTVRSLEKAEWELNRFMSDQINWSADYCKAISSFSQRARQIRKELENG